MSQHQPNQSVCLEDGCDRLAKTRGLCQKHYHRLWRTENAEQVRERQREYAEKNREKNREYQRQRYLANREQILAREREQYGTPEYRERKRKAAAKWARQNPERARLNARRGRAKRTYGLTLEEYDAILARGCAICGSHEGRLVGKRSTQMRGQPKESLCLDHCHTSGKVRSALCHGCNSGLGLFADDPARLRAAADYLEKHEKGGSCPG